MKMKKYAEAKAAFDKALSYDPKNIEVKKERVAALNALDESKKEAENR